jgi:hypothetical protein
MKRSLELPLVTRINHGLLMRAIVAADQHKKRPCVPRGSTLAISRMWRQSANQHDDCWICILDITQCKNAQGGIKWCIQLRLYLFHPFRPLRSCLFPGRMCFSCQRRTMSNCISHRKCHAWNSCSSRHDLAPSTSHIVLDCEAVCQNVLQTADALRYLHYLFPRLLKRKTGIFTGT